MGGRLPCHAIDCVKGGVFASHFPGCLGTSRGECVVRRGRCASARRSEVVRSLGRSPLIGPKSSSAKALEDALSGRMSIATSMLELISRDNGSLAWGDCNIGVDTREQAEDTSAVKSVR
jgi:hypothetical protein